MKVVTEAKEFEWDGGNRDKIWQRHRVKSLEAEEALANEPKILLEDARHSTTEARYGLLGVTSDGRRLAVVFTLRQGRVRVITARDMRRKERKLYLIYEKQNETQTQI